MFKKILPISKQNSEYSLSRPTNAWGISVPKYIKCSSLTGRPLPVQGWVGEGPEKEGGHFLPNSTTSYTSRLILKRTFTQV